MWRAIPSIILLFSIPVQAGSIWWDNDEGEEDLSWGTTDNWREADPPTNPPSGPPAEGQATYITTSDTHPFPDPAVAVVDVNDAQAGNLYVGGWIDSFDGDHGDASAQNGELRIVGEGALDLDDSYLRVGTRGATGRIVQSGGTLTSSRKVTIGWLSSSSVGSYELSSGTLDSSGIGVGSSGLGSFVMTGGTIDAGESGEGGHIGRGYYSVGQIGTGAQQGVGVYVQSGGTHDVRTLLIGTESGSAGVALLKEDADLDVKYFRVGEGGTGALVQSGGTVSVTACLELGFEGGSVGSYSVEAGTLEQTGTNGSANSCEIGNGQGFYLGVYGAAAFTVVGNDSEIDVVRYYQNARSTLAFVVDEEDNGTDPALTIIQVSKRAEFEPGAMIRIAAPDTVDFVPALDLCYDEVILLEAAEGIDDRDPDTPADVADLVLVGPEAGEWTLNITNPSGAIERLVASRTCP